MNDEYLSKHIITYMGNKRKILPHIEDLLNHVKNELAVTNLVCADAFSGSGIVSRLLKKHSSKLYVNDSACYSQTLNKCFLASPTKHEHNKISQFIDEANKFVTDDELASQSFIEKHWSEGSDSGRAYFTQENGHRIDKYRHFINTLPPKYRDYLLSMLLVKSSIHNNTNGHFSAFYKDANGRGMLGGKQGIDLKRICKPIVLDMPVFHINKCDVHVSCADSNQWVKTLPKLDVMYIDPPYNKHPYSIYYFMLQIINDWNCDQDIPNTLRGQPVGWERSAYNSYTHALSSFEDLLNNVTSKYIILSYNNKGIIPIDKIEELLQKIGTVKTYEITHKTYNRLEGVANYKRTKTKTHNIPTKEYLWLVCCDKF